MNSHSDPDPLKKARPDDESVSVTKEFGMKGRKTTDAGEFTSLVFWYKDSAYRCPSWLWRVLLTIEKKHKAVSWLSGMPVPVLKYLLTLVKLNAGSS